MEKLTQEISAANFKIVSCQASIFTPDEEISPVKLSKAFLPKYFERFDSDPITLPSMEGMPKDVPRIILRDKNNAWECQFASGRVNYIRRQSGFDDDLSLEDFFKDALELLLEYKKFQCARVGRIAGVIGRYTECEMPGHYLANHFCRDEWQKNPFNRPESFELHAHKKFKLFDDLIVNSWVRNKTGTVTQHETVKPIILFEQDINTLQEEQKEKDFSEKEITDFIISLPKEMDFILNLYYP